jgi:ABC-type transport system substrate-binding protein
MSRSEDRRRLVLGALAAGALPALPAMAPRAQAAVEEKVLRLSFYGAETSFDPARVSDMYSRTVIGHIFEALYAFDHLADPVSVRPLSAAGMPEVSADFKVWTIRLKSGIYFTDDPAFKGQRRELVAQDFVYQFLRIVDPANISPVESDVIEIGLRGLTARRDQAKASGRMDYDTPVPGLRALDRYTLRLETDQPRPRLLYSLVGSDVYGGVAREVVEHYGEDIGAHPVGTGPFKLAEWRRSSRVVLVRNPQYREVLWDASPGADDKAGQAIVARLKGRRLPLVDRVEVSILEESQPRWLAFLNKEIDALGAITGPVPSEYVNVAMPGGKLAPNLAHEGVQGQRELAADAAMTYFNMEDPTVGGYTPEKIALRRAISLAYDVDREIRLLRRGNAIVAQGSTIPHTSGYDPSFKSEMGDYDPARANALLDLYGYADRNGDGWREQPDGSPLEVVMSNEPDQLSRQYGEMWKRTFDGIRVKVRLAVQQWPENMKSAQAGKLMAWFLGSSGTSPDGQGALARLYSGQIGSGNLAHFRHAGFDRLYEKMLPMPDGPEREALFRECKRLAVAYMPYKVHVHRIQPELQHPWLIGFRKQTFGTEWWHMVDIDNDIRRRYVKS